MSGTSTGTKYSTKKATIGNEKLCLLLTFIEIIRVA
ncbi:hypothetical protein BROSI_A1908 [Candidatus Brocadia sinica JPN1]|uniref:Uncharacterized protein n=1 Tax=Candidatus Brocadia sinica JPN1 TaxID=1197129 RepID=A0ABQ0JXJ0_9BACT|nr:hypothetical protein BROSI_A1908 [Candidatus Brocadia sinica JPN1]